MESQPVPSSTVMVLRPVEAGFEVFMVRRHAKSNFMPDRYVFPGGKFEESDSSPTALARLGTIRPNTVLFRDVPETGAYNEAIPLNPAQQLGLYVTAFRELFEEAGVLLALEATTGQTLALDASVTERLAKYRQAEQPDFIGMLEQENLQLDFDNLIYFSHWITPKIEPRRFDTRFFVVRVPANQRAESDQLETSDGLWLRPSEILARDKADDFNMAYPTLLHIEWLSQYSTLDSAIEAARKRVVITAMPEPLDSLNSGKGFELKTGW